MAATTKASILDEAVRPPKRLTRWSTRTMAKAKGVSNATVHRLWKANDTKPHLTRTFKLSNESYLSVRDENPKRYVWKAEGSEILRKIQHARAIMNAQGFEWLLYKHHTRESKESR